MDRCHHGSAGGTWLHTGHLLPAAESGYTGCDKCCATTPGTVLGQTGKGLSPRLGWWLCQRCHREYLQRENLHIQYRPWSRSTRCLPPAEKGESCSYQSRTGMGKKSLSLTHPLSTSLMLLAATTLLGTEPFPAHADLGTCSEPDILHIHPPRTAHSLPCFPPLTTAAGPTAL